MAQHMIQLKSEYSLLVTLQPAGKELSTRDVQRIMNDLMQV